MYTTARQVTVTVKRALSSSPAAAYVGSVTTSGPTSDRRWFTAVSVARDTPDAAWFDAVEALASAGFDATPHTGTSWIAASCAAVSGN